MAESPPSWKFWWPLSIWKVLLIFFLSNLALQLVGVALREGLGQRWVSPAGMAGAAGMLGVLVVSNLARKQRLASPEK